MIASVRTHRRRFVVLVIALVVLVLSLRELISPAPPLEHPVSLDSTV